MEEVQAEGILQAISTVDEPISHGATNADWQVAPVLDFQILVNTGNGGL